MNELFLLVKCRLHFVQEIPKLFISTEHVLRSRFLKVTYGGR